MCPVCFQWRLFFFSGRLAALVSVYSTGPPGLQLLLLLGNRGIVSVVVQLFFQRLTNHSRKSLRELLPDLFFPDKVCENSVELEATVVLSF